MDTKDNPATRTTFTYGMYTDTREECVKKFGSIFELPITENAYTETRDHYRGGDLLDVGAGKHEILRKALGIDEDKYFTIDTDPEGEFDYNLPSDIPEDKRFEMMVANQFFEHLEIQESVDMVTALSKYLSPKGYFIASVPNVMHPNRYMGDITHRTFWDYKAMYTLLRYGGLDVTRIARFSKRAPTGIVEKFIARKVQEIYRMDWADSIVIIGQKP